MSKVNDAKIMKLKEEVAEKRKAVKKASKRFSPITNCILNIDGTTQNIQVLTADQLTMLLIELNAWKMSAADLGIRVPKMQGYDIEDWITDIKARLDNLNVNKTKKELDALEKQLNNLLSDDKKTELEIEQLSNMLKEL